MRNKRHKKKNKRRGIDGFVDKGEEEYYMKKKYARGEEFNNESG